MHLCFTVLPGAAQRAHYVLVFCFDLPHWRRNPSRLILWRARSPILPLMSTILLVPTILCVCGLACMYTVWVKFIHQNKQFICNMFGIFEFRLIILFLGCWRQEDDHDDKFIHLAMVACFFIFIFFLQPEFVMRGRYVVEKKFPSSGTLLSPT